MSVDRLTVGWKASQQHTGIDDQREVWAIADQGGFDSLWLFDHLLPLGQVRAGDILEAWTLLGALAQATARVRIGTLVTSALYRHPALLAKMAVTVDHVSAGRLLMGLDEVCAVLKLLWTEDLTTFRGRHVTIDNLAADPKPAQRPHPPLWIATNGPRLGLQVAARRADVWLTSSLGTDQVDGAVRLSSALDRHCLDLGRDPATVRRAVQFRTAQDDDGTLRAAEAYVLAGFTDLVLMPFRGGPQAAEAATGLLPRLRALG